MSSNKPGDIRHHIACDLSTTASHALTARARRLGISRAQFARQVLEEFLEPVEPSPGRSWELDANSEVEPRT